MEVNTSVSPSLHPDNVRALEGYDDSTADAVADVVSAFATAYEGITNVHLARKAAAQNPTLTEAAQILVVADFAEKHFKKITMKFDVADARLTAAIKDAERQLNQPLDGASTGGYTSEVRAHVRGLNQSERYAFVREAVGSGDTKTASAVLGAPSYLSGLTPVEQETLTRAHHERANPLLANRLAVMKAAFTLLGERGGTVFLEIDKAIGADRVRVANLRAARANAERAYTFTA